MKWNELLAEFLGTLLLLVVVVGSGIMGDTLSAGNVAIALLANSIATGAGLFVLIQIFGPISGAHFNPAVTFYFLLQRQLNFKRATMYWLSQIFGGIVGVWLTHFIFSQPILQLSLHNRDGAPLFVSEIMATMGLLLTILGFSAHEKRWVPVGVGLYITGAYWFTSSTSFANPAVTIARGLTDTFAGIAPHSVPPFVVAQVVGVLLFAVVWKFLAQSPTSEP